MLFGVPDEGRKDAVGSAGTDPDGILNVAICATWSPRSATRRS